MLKAKVERLIPYARNSRTHSDAQVAQIAASIKEFGFLNPIIIDGDNGIIAGHGRVLAARKLGLIEVPVVEAAHLSDTQKRAYIIADNKLALNAGWDNELLALELGELGDAGFDLDLTGFELNEISALLTPSGTEGLTDPDEVPEPPAQPVTKPGDVWLMGRHRIMCGDGTDAGSVALLMNGARCDMCFTSPPYASQREYNGGDMSVETLRRFIPASASSVGYFVVNLGLSRSAGEIVRYWDDYISAAESADMKLLAWLVWDKGECGSIGNQSAMFGIRHEWIFVFGDEAKKLNRTVPNKYAGEVEENVTIRQARGETTQGWLGVINSHRQLDSVINQSAQKARNLGFDHPAMFPVDLPIKFIEAMTASGGSVYEPFSGSGTTIIAAEQTGRRCYAMELSPQYVDVAIKRWQDFTGGKAVLESNGVAWNE